MRKETLNITFDGNNYAGFEYERLPLGAARLYAAQQIDEAADNARVGVVGNSLRVVEYQLAEQEAKAFQAAGFEGAVRQTCRRKPPLRASWPRLPPGKVRCMRSALPVSRASSRRSRWLLTTRPRPLPTRLLPRSTPAWSVSATPDI